MSSALWTSAGPVVGRQEDHLACKKLSDVALSGYLSGARCK